MLNKLIFDFCSDYVTVFYQNKIVFQEPSAIIITKSLEPTVITYGFDAIKNREMSGEDSIFVYPIRKGAVAHFDGVKLFIKSVFREIKEKPSLLEVCVLISCCLDIEQKKDIERAFISAGVSNIYLLERLLAFSDLSEKSGAPLVCTIFGEESDIGFLKEKSIMSGYFLDMGGNNIDHLLKKLFEETYKIHLSDLEISKIKNKIGSLYGDDTSRMEINGFDILSGGAKRISLCSKDIFEKVDYVYSRIIKVIEGALMAAPTDIVRQTAEKGIIFGGTGVLMQGFEEYVYKKLKIFPIVIKNAGFYLESCYNLISDEKWLSSYLGIKI